LLNLYPINQDILYVLDTQLDPETGEISEIGIKQLDELYENLEDRALAIAVAIKELLASRDAIKRVVEERTRVADTLSRRADALARQLDAELDEHRPDYKSKGRTIYASNEYAEVTWAKSQTFGVDDISSLPVLAVRLKPNPPPAIDKKAATALAKGYYEKHGKWPKWGHVNSHVKLKIK
jgi:hypothetical protein